MASLKGRTLELEIYVPMSSNEGQRYPPELLAKFKDTLTEEFGGVTDTNHKNKGIWKVNGIEFHDEIVVWRVFTDDPGKLEVIRGLKAKMEKELGQEKVLCLLREVQIL